MLLSFAARRSKAYSSSTKSSAPLTMSELPALAIARVMMGT